MEQQQRLQSTLRSANTSWARRVITAEHSTAQAVDAAIYSGEPPDAQDSGDAAHVDKCVVTGRSSLEDSRAGKAGAQAKDITQVGTKKGTVKRKRAISKNIVSHDKNKKRCLEIPEDEDPGAKEEKPMETMLIPVVRPTALRQATMEEYLRDNSVPK